MLVEKLPSFKAFYSDPKIYVYILLIRMHNLIGIYFQLINIYKNLFNNILWNKYVYSKHQLGILHMKQKIL